MYTGILKLYVQAHTLILIYFSYIGFIKTSTLSSHEIKNISRILKGEFGCLLFMLILGGSEYLFKHFYVIFCGSTSAASLKLWSVYKLIFFTTIKIRLLMTQIFGLKCFLENLSDKFHKTLIFFLAV